MRQLDKAANSILYLSLIYAPLSLCRRCGANRNIGQQEERFQSIQLLPSGSTLPMEMLFVLGRHLSSLLCLIQCQFHLHKKVRVGRSVVCVGS